MLDVSLDGIRWELIFVDDDSPDGTIAAVRDIGRRRSNIRGLHRVGRRGLASACIEGMLASGAPYIAVMDADLQHDEALLPRMLETLRRGEADIVVGSRFGEGASVGSFRAGRVMLSRLGNLLGQMVIGTRLSDPLSGFFMLRRELLDGVVHELSGRGFKILLDLLASARGPVRIQEMPFHFRQRQHGESKLDGAVILEYVYLLAEKMLGSLLPLRFILFLMVGGFGLFVHLGVLSLALHLAGLAFYPAQVVATFTAMTINFTLNNVITYRDRRLRGSLFLRGLLSFYVACGLGALINFQLAASVYDLGAPWALAGLIGAGASSVWNFAVTNAFTWKAGRRRRAAATATATAQTAAPAAELAP